MDIKQLTTFREVVLTGSVSAAARNLGRTQPAVSHMLSKLEDELGLELFERRNGRLYPVPETDYLFRQASRVLDDLDGIEATIRRMRNVQAGALRIVSMPGPAVEFLPSLIARHLAGEPDIRVTLLSRSSVAVHRLVEAQQFDIGLADHMPDHAFGQSASRTTFRFSRVCAVAATHPLANKSEISLRDLSGLPLATLFAEHATTQELRAKFQAEGLEFNPRFEGQFFLHLLPYVLGGHAYALIDPIAKASWIQTRRNAEDIKFIPVKPTLSFNVDLITSTGQPRSQLSKYFEACIVTELEELLK